MGSTGLVRINSRGSVGIADNPLSTTTGTIAVESVTGDLHLENTLGLELGETRVPGDLGITTTTGNITDTGPVTVGGDSTFTTTEPNAGIALDQTIVTGTISLNTSGDDGNATLTADTATLGQSSVGGALSATTNGDLTVTGDINAGAIALISQNQNIQAENSTLDTSSVTGPGGPISLISNGTVTVNDIITEGTDGGDVNIQAITSITTGAIDTEGLAGQGGDVFLDPENDIEVEFIDARGTAGGGTVDITTERFFRATGIIPGTQTARNPSGNSIATTGGTNGTGDSVTIRHGGDSDIPFIVGDAGVNGTAGGIATGEASLDFREYPFTYTENPNIRLISVPAPPGPPDPPPNPPIPPIQTEGLCAPIDTGVADIDEKYTREFEEYLGQSSGAGGQSLVDTCDALGEIADISGIRPAVIYANFVPVEFNVDIIANADNQSVVTVDEKGLGDELELVLVTPDGQPVRYRVPGATREKVLAVVDTFHTALEDEIDRSLGGQSYLSAAQQLYGWLITPLQADLKAEAVENLVFIADEGLRSLPFAALHDGDQYLI